MSAYNMGKKPCLPDGNGCLCPVCVNWQTKKRVPLSCHKGRACGNCDPDRTEPDDWFDYGPMRQCVHYKSDPARIAFFAESGGTKSK